MAQIMYREALNQALAEEMRRDPLVFAMGEGIGERGGSYKVTEGLIKEYGPGRVMDTPISESAFIGAAIGAATAGLRPVVELMFNDFMGVCFDQIFNQAAKFRYMFGGKAETPVTIRAMVGGGFRAAAQHSQSLYWMTAGIPGLKTVIPSNPAETLPLLIIRRRQVTKPISAPNAFKLLDSFDQSTWHGLRNYTMVAVLWALGLRTGELTSLRVNSFETGHGKKIGLLRVRGKNKKQRALFVVDRLFDDLTRYLAHPQSPKKKRAPLFPAQPDTAISNNRLQNIVKQQAKKAGIKARVTPRVLRHCFATEMYHQNVPLDAIQMMMGHDSSADTSIYVHVSDKLKQLALDNIRISRRTSWQ